MGQDLGELERQGMARKTKVEEEEEVEEAPIYGDVLELILSHVPLVDLAHACLVSNPWKHAVSSSLSHFNRLKPWLVVHTQTTRSPYVTTTHAYDPRSQLWLHLKQPPIRYVSALRSSHSTLLYMLSPSKLSFSYDPLHLAWHHAQPPLVWRTDPIVSVVGSRIIIAGGSCDFEDDPLAVEIYDIESRSWDSCQSMPATLKDSAASTWLSIAVNDRQMFVTEKTSGATYSFDPATKTWHGPYDLRPDPSVFFSAIGFAGDRMILVGLIGDADNVKNVKVWKINEETMKCEVVGEMPQLLLEKLRNGNSTLVSIGVTMKGDFIYIHNTLGSEALLCCEFRSNGEIGWSVIENVIVSDRTRLGSLVFTCSDVGIHDVHKALRSDNRRFAVQSVE